VQNAQQIRLRDSRLLGFSEFGLREGRPVFYFHGFPGTRLEAGTVHRQAEQLGVRLIAVDRPGYGASDFQPKRRVSQWPDDIAQLADALELARFSVLGVSGGVPYAAACAWKLPHRVERAGLVCGLAPLDAPEALSGLPRRYRVLKALPEICLRPFLVLAGPLAVHAPRWCLAQIARSLPEKDRETLAIPQVREPLSLSLAEAFRQGSAGPFRDLCLLGQPWGFALEDIAADVTLWHGEDDTVVPVAMGHYLAEKIPRCAAIFLKAEGHFSLPIGHAGLILSTLLE